MSINGVYESEHVKLMDQHYEDCTLHADFGLFFMFGDAFTTCTNVSNGIPLFGLISDDAGPELFAHEINRRPVMLVSPPEPPNTYLILYELIKNMNTLAMDGIIVTISERTFTYKTVHV